MKKLKEFLYKHTNQNNMTIAFIFCGIIFLIAAIWMYVGIKGLLG